MLEVSFWGKYNAKLLIGSTVLDVTNQLSKISKLYIN